MDQLQLTSASGKWQSDNVFSSSPQQNFAWNCSENLYLHLVKLQSRTKVITSHLRKKREELILPSCEN